MKLIIAPLMDGNIIGHHQTTPPIEYTFKPADNQFISCNLVNPLFFTIEIPEECDLFHKSDPLYKHFVCSYNNQRISIRPTEGARGLGHLQLKQVSSDKVIYGGFEWERTLYIFNDQRALAHYNLSHSKTNDNFLISVHYERYSDQSANFVNIILSTIKFGEKVTRVVAD